MRVCCTILSLHCFPFHLHDCLTHSSFSHLFFTSLLYPQAHPVHGVRGEGGSVWAVGLGCRCARACAMAAARTSAPSTPPPPTPAQAAPKVCDVLCVSAGSERVSVCVWCVCVCVGICAGIIFPLFWFLSLLFLRSICHFISSLLKASPSTGASGMCRVRAMPHAG